MHNLIGISGRISSGKDTLARMIELVMYNNVYRQKDGDISPTTDIILNRGLEDISKKYFGWEIKKFAYKLKRMTCLFLGCTMEQLEDQAFKDTNLGPEWAWKVGSDYLEPQHSSATYTVRQFMQRLGTEAIRNSIHPQAWVNALFADYKYEKTDDPPLKWLITDMRFPNEFEAVKSRGGLVFRIFNNNIRVKGLLHESETALDYLKSYHWDEYIDNSGSLEDLYKEAQRIVTKYKLS